MKIERFELTENHIQSLRKMCVGRNNDKYGAPTIDPKRPYGNSNMLEYIANIVGMNKIDKKKLITDYERNMEDIYLITQTVLQIFIQCASIELGTYECEGYSNKWKCVNKK